MKSSLAFLFLLFATASVLAQGGDARIEFYNNDDQLAQLTEVLQGGRERALGSANPGQEKVVEVSNGSVVRVTVSGRVVAEYPVQGTQYREVSISNVIADFPPGMRRRLPANRPPASSSSPSNLGAAVSITFVNLGNSKGVELFTIDASGQTRPHPKEISPDQNLSVQTRAGVRWRMQIGQKKLDYLATGDASQTVSIQQLLAGGPAQPTRTPPPPTIPTPKPGAQPGIQPPTPPGSTVPGTRPGNQKPTVPRANPGTQPSLPTPPPNPPQKPVVVQPAPSAPKPASDSVSKLNESERKAFVELHNQARSEVGVGEVKWSDELAKVAQEWADRLARDGSLVHRPQQGKDSTQFGENLAMGVGGGYRPIDGVQDWFDEKKDYEPGTAISMHDRDKLNKIGHYTQMVWKGTTEIGAGYAVIRKGPYKGGLVVVCNYNPAGNLHGQKPF